jgi:ABC-type Na+ efflux pump permease subunit
MKLILGLLAWVIAIAALAGTIALFTWLAVLFFRKDTRDDSTRNRH